VVRSKKPSLVLGFGGRTERKLGLEQDVVNKTRGTEHTTQRIRKTPGKRQNQMGKLIPRCAHRRSTAAAENGHSGKRKRYRKALGKRRWKVLGDG